MRELLRPKWILSTLLAVLGVAVLIRLGIWQLDRLTQRRAFNARVEVQLNQPALDLNQTPLPADLWDMEYRAVQVRGRYVPQEEVLLRNQAWQDRPGYHLLTPLVIEGGGAKVLVDRGWIPLPDDRNAVPDTLAPADPTTITGYIGPEPTVGIELGPAAAEAELMSPQVYRVQRVHVPGVESMLDRKLWPGVVYLDANELGALTVNWQLPGDGSARNRSYAVQWFAMATMLAGLGLWNLYGRKRGHG